MTKNRMIKIIIGLFFVMALQGCQQIRLLQFKNQLKNMDESLYFSSHTIHFKTPVLEASDILYLTKSPPSSIVTDASNESWYYELIKKENSEKNNLFTLNFQLNFQNKLLTEVLYPQQIAQLFGDYLTTLGFNSIGKGTYLGKPNVLIPGKPENYRIDKKELPSPEKVVQHFGKPTEVKETETHNIFIYDYVVKNEKEKMDSAWMRFSFKKSSDTLSEVSGTIFGPLIQFGFN